MAHVPAKLVTQMCSAERVMRTWSTGGQSLGTGTDPEHGAGRGEPKAKVLVSRRQRVCVL